jgi:hypothetical protein
MRCHRCHLCRAIAGCEFEFGPARRTNEPISFSEPKTTQQRLLTQSCPPRRGGGDPNQGRQSLSFSESSRRRAKKSGCPNKGFPFSTVSSESRELVPHRRRICPPKSTTGEEENREQESSTHDFAALLSHPPAAAVAGLFAP